MMAMNRDSSKKNQNKAKLSDAFFNAEEQFKKSENEWQIQRGRSRHQHKPSRSRDELRNNSVPERNFSENPNTQNDNFNVEVGRYRGTSHCSSRSERNRNSKNTKDFGKCYSEASSVNRKKVCTKTREEGQKSNNESHTFHETNQEKEEKLKKDHCSPPGISFTRLQQIYQKNSTDIIRSLANSHSGLDEFLTGKIKPDCMYLIVKILSKLTKSDWEENKEHVLLKASNPEFFKKITSFVTELVTDEQSFHRKEEMELFFENLLTFFSAVMTILPMVAADHLKKPLVATKMAMENVTEFQNVAINTKLHEKIKGLLFDFEERKKEKEEREKILLREQEPVYPKPLGSIRNVPLFPRPEDIAMTSGVIVPNKVKGAYNNVEQYLDVQFRLLREDFMSPIRQGINEYRIGNTRNKAKGSKKLSNIRIYPRVKFLKPKVIADKVGYDICFDPEKRLKVKWEYSKRFIFGSLLLFTTDNFHSFFIATVVKRDLDLMGKERIVSVTLSDTTELSQEILSKEYVCAESEVYFEPYYNVLKALQKFDADTFPFKNYLVHVENKTNRPSYTKNGCDIYTISAGQNGINGKKTIKLFDSHSWPDASELGFDQSQMNAFKAAITNDLCVIQGPPGTGKTYIGLKIAQALLENSAFWNTDKKTPILVICYTNHALDQFLEGIIQNNITNSLVRIGGRSKSELLELFNLKEKRKTVVFYSPNRDQTALLKDLKVEMSEVFENIKILQDNLNALDKNEGIVSLKTLKIVMSDIHQRHLSSNDDLLEWLLYGVNIRVKSHNKLLSTKDKEASRHIVEDVEFDTEDFENVTRLKEVLFDSMDFGGTDDSASSNSGIRLYFSCTLEEIKKKIEEYGVLLANLPESEEKREVIQQRMKEAREAETDLQVIYAHFEGSLKKTPIPSTEVTEPLLARRDIHSFNSVQRWTLYKSWMEGLKAGYAMMIGKLEEKFRKGSRRYEEVRQFDDLSIVQQADVVGITTTTAARLQAMLRELRPKIVIVEEAAEVLEAHIVASLSVYCQHLILIGDHKQLRPSPAEYKLAKDYHLDVSLFERLINNGVNFHTLSTQHRMRPEISRLLVPTIYNSLKDHPSTQTREKIRGMDTNLFFFTHNNFEEGVDDIMSKRNIFEAKMVMLLARHLVLQGYRPDEITVLTTYSGQMYLMKEEQKRLEISKDLLVITVDNYQGEENRIILLSLVRSNPENRIGFLKTENRVCVALSRARDGLFVFGNMDCLTAESVLWQRIRQSFLDQNAFGPALVLRCETHHNNITRIMTPADFTQVMEGGCNRPCEERLPCGHKCKSLCHVSKDRHTRYRCSEPCNRYLCVEKHLCQKRCYQLCDKCTTAMERTLTCGHKIVLPCCVDYRSLQCKEMEVVTFPECNHQVQFECFRKGFKKCPEPCKFRLECGHACVQTCHPLEDPDHLQYSCLKACERRPLCCTMEGHKCPLTCSESCEPCQAMVTRKLKCGHSVTVPCVSPDPLCTVPCPRTLACKHPCKRQCWEQCGGCSVKVEKTVNLCGHKVKVRCDKVPAKEDCEGDCCVTLECGHKCAKRCKERCDVNDCKKEVPMSMTLPCGHKNAEVPCNLSRNVNFDGLSSREQLVKYCREPCLQKLQCEHICSGSCGECMQGRIHKVCEEDCNNTLICGHSCPVPCRQICPPCEKKCQNQCSHTKCPKKCGEPCVPCMERCDYRCVHSECTRRCGELCNRKPCTEPCFLTLSCGHGCVGFCGDPCPPCKICEPDHYWYIIYSDEETADEAKWVLLNDCKHVVESSVMEEWLQSQDSTEIKLKRCPKCRPSEPHCNLVTTQRYMNLVKNTFKDIQAVKIKLFGQVQDIREKREQLLRQVQAMSPKIMDSVVGHDSEKDELYCLHKHLLSDLPIIRNNRRKEIDNEELNLLEYMVRFLDTLVKRRNDIWNKLNNETKLKISNKINALTKALRDRKKKISKPETDSFSLEIQRIIRLGDLMILESSGEFAELKSKREVIQCFEKAERLVNQPIRYTDVHDGIVASAIEELKKVTKSSAHLSAKTLREINMAMSSSFYGGSSAQGHWFKCPNGHIYVITECGGAMEKARCPEKGCGAMIGGQNHTYLPGQQLASEMDGATRPAWSSGFDMRNFDLNNLH